MSVLPLLARAFILGIAVAAPVGAMSVLLIQRTLIGGWPRGLATGLGIATADAAYAALAAIGLAVLQPFIVRYAPLLQVGGGLVLIALGVRAFRTPPPEPGTEPPGSPATAYGSAVALTLANPMTIAAFAAALAAIGVLAEGGPLAIAVAVLGVGAGSLSWWLLLTFVVAAGRDRVGSRGLRILSQGTSIVLAALGALMALRVIVPLLMARGA